MRQSYLLQQPTALETLATAAVADWVTSIAGDLVAQTFKRRSHHPTEADALLSQQIETIRKHILHNVSNAHYNELASNLLKKIPKLLKKSSLPLHAPNQSGRSPPLCDYYSLRHPLDSNDERLHLEGLNDYFYAYQNANNVVTRMIETVFTTKLTRLIVGDVPIYEDKDTIEYYNTWDIFKSSFCSKANLLSGLVDLQIKSTQAKPGDMIQLLKELHNLKYLHITIDDEIGDSLLKCITDNCKLIEKLRIEPTEFQDYLFARTITDESIDILTQLRNLKHMSLIAPRVTKKGVAKLLLCCENIERVYVNEKVTTESVLESISSNEEHVGKHFKLTSYEDRSDTTAEQLRLVVQMCPKIQDIKLTRSTIESQNYLLPLKDLPDLRELTLSSFPSLDSYMFYYTDRVQNILDSVGSNLQNLYLDYVYGINLDVLTCIYQACPNLETLLVNCNFVKETTGAQSSSTVRSIPLRSLKKIYLGSLGSRTTHRELRFILSNCPNVEFIYIDGLGNLLDNVICEVLEGTENWTHLKELKISGTELSKFAIDRIVEKCINRPEVIKVMWPKFLFFDDSS